MSKITDASFIAHQYTSVSSKAIEKANRYSFLENQLQATAPPSEPRTGSLRHDRPEAAATRCLARLHSEHPRDSTRNKTESAGKPAGQARGAAQDPRAVPHPHPAGFPYFEISMPSAAVRSRHPGRFLHGLAPQPASQPARTGRSRPSLERRETITPGRRPCAAHPRGRWPPK